MSNPRGARYPLSTYTLMQASLLSNIRSNPNQSGLFNYSNIQHLGDYQPRYSELSETRLPQISMRLQQNLARILTYITEELPEGFKGRDIVSSSLFDSESINWEIMTACKGFIDSIHDRSDQAHFVGSFVDAYDIFIAGFFYIHLEQQQGPGARVEGSRSDPNSSQKGRLSAVNDVVNKCCTLIVGIESRFGAIKAFRRVLRDFFAVTMGQYSSDGTSSVRVTFLFSDELHPWMFVLLPPADRFSSSYQTCQTLCPDESPC